MWENGREVVVEDTATANFAGIDIALFSAGGATNNDLPPTSNYREVRPVALTMLVDNGVFDLRPFAIDWERYNHVDLNGFLRPAT